MKELLTRSQVSVSDTWDLTAMYPDKAAWQSDLDRAASLGDSLRSMAGTLGQSAPHLKKALDLLEELEIILNRTSIYASCLSDEDTGDTAHQSMRAQTETAIAQAAEKTAYMDPELLTIPDETYETFYAACPDICKYRLYLRNILRLRDYTLSAELETLMALSQETRDASANTFCLLNDADLRFPSVRDSRGEETPLSHGRFIGLLCSPDRRVRKDAFEAYYSTYRKLLNTFASLYSGQVKSLVFNARARHYNSTLEAAVIPNDVTPAVYRNLIDAVNDNLDALHSYVSLRKRLLGVDTLHMYDIYVPMLADYDMKVSFEEARETAMKALAPLGEDYLSVLKTAFENRWIDVYENQGKRSGAYETCAYGCHPYVLLNHDNKLDDMFTLVHELGHAMHSYYSDHANSYFDSRYMIFVAEVASTTNELLFLEYLLDNAESTDMKRYLLNHYLDMFKGTIFRQTQFAEFELETNRMVENGDSLNADNLNQLYLALNKKYYGPDMVSDDEIACEWARIPHFYYNFYVYQYATSLCASISIVQKIRQEGEPAVNAYRRFLSGGCTKPPVELLRDMGVDLETKAPICSAIDVCRKALQELEALS